HVAARRLLVALLADAEPVPAVRRVPSVTRAPHDRHRRDWHSCMLASRRWRGENRTVPAPAPRPRPRQLGLTFGALPTGEHNAITDVPGVTVGHTTVWRDPADGDDGIGRTGATAVVFDGLREIYERPMAAGTAVLNGAGELTGTIE